jgi:hypothetical protein
MARPAKSTAALESTDVRVADYLRVPLTVP